MVGAPAIDRCRWNRHCRESPDAFTHQHVGMVRVQRRADRALHVQTFRQVAHILLEIACSACPTLSFDFPLRCFAQLPRLTLSNGLHLRRATTEVASNGRHHRLRVQRLIVRASQPTAGVPLHFVDQQFVCFVLNGWPPRELDVSAVCRKSNEGARTCIESCTSMLLGPRVGRFR